jgi:hypothetical protein
MYIVLKKVPEYAGIPCSCIMENSKFKLHRASVIRATLMRFAN